MRRLKWRIILSALGFVVALWFLLPHNRSRELAERTRQELVSAGFKVSLSEFTLGVASPQNGALEQFMSTGGVARPFLRYRDSDLLRPVNDSSALVLWNENDLSLGSVASFWDALRDDLDTRGPELDALCQELATREIRIPAVMTPSGLFALPNLIKVRPLASTLALYTLVALHDSNRTRSWAGLFALTRLITAWQTEPVEALWGSKMRCVAVAQRATWQALQADRWTDDQLLTLQREWSKADFFSALPDTAAVRRAELLAWCNHLRLQPLAPSPSARQIGSDLLDDPSRAWSGFTSGMRQSHYRSTGSYEDEVAIMRCFRERETDLRHAIQATTWLAMRALPGTTNPAPYLGDPASPITSMVTSAPNNFGPPWFAGALLSRAAEAEARRRLIICALALVRFKLAQGHFPPSLDQLVPKFLDMPPVDFMDGQLLRYRINQQGSFLLYSVGLNCVDEHGELARNDETDSQGRFRPVEERDIVWPCPASPEEVKTEKERNPTLLQFFLPQLVAMTNNMGSPVPQRLRGR